MQTDKELMVAIAQKDPDAFQQLVARYMDKLYFFICRQLDGEAERADAAKDIMQEVFLKVWLTPNSWDSAKGQFRSWLWVVAANKCRDRQREQKFFYYDDDQLDNVIDFAPLPDRRAEVSSELNHVNQAIETLPQRQKQALYLSVYDGLSYKEIAAAMDISAAAVESLLVRARATLRQFTQTPKKKTNQEVANVC